MGAKDKCEHGINDGEFCQMCHSARNEAERMDGLRRAIAYGKTNKNKIQSVDLYLLDRVANGLCPVGNNSIPPEDVSAMLYEIKDQRDKLLRACELALAAY